MIEPYYRKPGNARSPIGLERMVLVQIRHQIQFDDLADMGKRIEALFKGRHVEREIIILCVRWCLPVQTVIPRFGGEGG